MFAVCLILAALLCSMVTGFLFAYAVVIMPGIKSADDAFFLKCFQITDRIIQDNQPLFIGMWLGSAVALILALIFGFGHLGGADLVLLILATLAYLAGVQVSTVRIHLPLNNHLQTLVLDEMSPEALKQARDAFEGPWNRSNVRRTAMSFGVSLVLIYLAFSV